LKKFRVKNIRVKKIRVKKIRVKKTGKNLLKLFRVKKLKKML